MYCPVWFIMSHFIVMFNPRRRKMSVNDISTKDEIQNNISDSFNFQKKFKPTKTDVLSTKMIYESKIKTKSSEVKINNLLRIFNWDTLPSMAVFSNLSIISKNNTMPRGAVFLISKIKNEFSLNWLKNKNTMCQNHEFWNNDCRYNLCNFHEKTFFRFKL